MALSEMSQASPPELGHVPAQFSLSQTSPSEPGRYFLEVLRRLRSEKGDLRHHPLS
jgi:hypothetical protein